MDVNIKINDPRESSFEKWWEAGGKTPLGDRDIVDKERALKGYNDGIEWMKNNLNKVLTQQVDLEHTRKPFVERRGIYDSVNKSKFIDSFLSGMRDVLEKL